MFKFVVKKKKKSNKMTDLIDYLQETNKTCVCEKIKPDIQ